MGVGARARVRVGVGVGVRVRDAAHLGLVEWHGALPALHLRAPPPEVVLQAAAPEPLEHEAQGVGRRVGVVQRADEARGDLLHAAQLGQQMALRLLPWLGLG